MTGHRNNVKSPWRTCNRIGGTGDKGQRFEVRYKDGVGTERAFGWTDVDASAQAMVESINLHPSFHSPRIIDRKADQA